MRFFIYRRERRSIYYYVEFSENVTSAVFYNEILPQIHKYFGEVNQRINKEIVFDFSRVKYINPSTIPNIINVGLIIKNYFSRPVKLIITWREELLAYLCDINFFTLSNKFEIFEFDQSILGGFSRGKLNDKYFTYCFEQNTSKQDISLQLAKSVVVMQKLYQGKESDEFVDEIRKILYLFTEICHNACKHSEKMCFATFQNNMTESVKYKKAHISISDCGIGYYNSLLRKSAKYGLSTIFCIDKEIEELESDRNYIAILEALFHRRKSENYGLYHVMRAVVEADGVLRIHSNDTQLVITKKFYEENLKDLNANNIKKLISYFKVHENSVYSNIRNYKAKFKGVHIELEIPICTNKV